MNGSYLRSAFKSFNPKTPPIHKRFERVWRFILIGCLTCIRMTRPLLTILLTALLVLAGCSSGVGLGTDGPTEPGTTGSDAASVGTVNFYISDERNDISDFEHLNVTVTKVGFQTTDDDEGEGDDGTETEEDDDGTETETVTETETETNTETDTETETEDADEDEADDDEDEGEAEEARAGWVEFDIESQTIDLTELQGEKATLIDSYELPEGSYTKVFLYVSEVNGTLKNGEQVNVKLPSSKLHLNKQFEVGDGGDVDFVFDITVHKAGKSGKYILTPVVGESGTDVSMEKVDKQGNPVDDEDEDVNDAADQKGDGDNTKAEEANENASNERHDESSNDEGNNDLTESQATATPTETATESTA